MIAEWQVTTLLAGPIHENLRYTPLLSIFFFSTLWDVSGSVSSSLHDLGVLSVVHPFFLTPALYLQASGEKQSEQLRDFLLEFYVDV